MDANGSEEPREELNVMALAKEISSPKIALMGVENLTCEGESEVLPTEVYKQRSTENEDVDINITIESSAFVEQIPEAVIGEEQISKVLECASNVVSKEPSTTVARGENRGENMVRNTRRKSSKEKAVSVTGKLTNNKSGPRTNSP